MTEQEFTVLLREVRDLAFDFAKEFVITDLAKKIRYDINLNQSHDEPRLEKFDHYLQDEDKSCKDLNESEIVKLLVRNKKVPIWIDISVKTVRNGYTIMHLSCAGRYSENKNEYYYENRGSGPFGIKSPIFPSDYKKGTKFNLFLV